MDYTSLTLPCFVREGLQKSVEYKKIGVKTVFRQFWEKQNFPFKMKRIGTFS